MQKHFAHKIEEMRRLIEDSRSASVSVGGSGNHWDRKNPSHFVAARCKSPLGCLLTALDPCGQGGSTLSAPVVSTSAPRYLLAVSGGMDSMCMADLFLQSFGAESFAIAHCNFSLRGEESDGDEALVREWAERNDIQLFVKRFDTVSYAHENGISIEMAARDLRYGWFADLCKEHGFAALSVAHNANDNAETLLLNLLRGTGLKGLHGMADISEMCAVGKVPENGEAMPPTARGCLSAAKTGGFGISGTLPVVICRPLLGFTRKQIEGYILTHRVPYRHDSSNFESDYKRNRIRNEVFPIFEKINPSFIRTLNREIGYFSEAEEIVSDWCVAQLPEMLVYDDNVQAAVSPSDSMTISLSRLLATPHWRYLLYHILEPYGFSSQVLSSLEDLLTSDRTVPGKRFESSTHVLLTGRDELKILPRECSGESLSDMPVHVVESLPLGNNAAVIVIRGAGTYDFNGSRFKVEVLPWTADMPLKQPAGVLVMDADKMKFPFVCRRWRHGDWLIPLGMKGKKKVSDMFTDLKYDALAKDAAIMMVDTRTEALAEQQHIAGVLGVRIDDRYKVTLPATRTVIRVSVCAI